MKYPILKMLQSFQNKNIRFCMPGHKGKFAFGGVGAFAGYDITELPGTDNLYCPQGCIAESEALAAKDHFAERAFYGVNGSSGCILAAFSYFRPGDKLIVARDLHVSAENAILMSGIVPVYVEVRQTVGEIPAAPASESFLQKMREHPDAKGVFFTYPNYYGKCLEAPKIARAAHAMGMLVVVDSAHGAHLPYSSLLPDSAGQIDADIWCASFHKTLPALNQSAVLFCSARADGDRLKERMNCFQTTSPSYLLLASIDYARGFMKDQGEEKIGRLLENIHFATGEIGKIPGMRVVPTDDPTKLVIDVAETGRTGFAVAADLHEKGVEIEGADMCNLLLIASVFDEKEDFLQLIAALKSIPTQNMRLLPKYTYLLGGHVELEPEETRRMQTEWADLRDSAGKIAAKSIFCYPPGVPIVLFGQRIPREMPNLLASLADTGYNLLGIDQKICVVKE